MKRLEFHCHTVYSKDSLMSLQNLLENCRRKGIDRLVITDHNTIAGAVRAREMDSELIIVGEEIMTQDGELLAAFVQEQVPPGLPPMEAVARLREQGAFISVSHPFDRFRKGGWSLTGLLEIAPWVDALETFNARCILPDSNRQAQAFARQHGLPGTVGSDAHVTAEVGKATLLLPDFSDAEGLRRSLPEAQAQVSLSPPWIHITSRYAKWKKKRMEIRG
jgi:hypothetical protein